MKLLEAVEWKEYPAGGENIPINVLEAFTVATSKGIKEIELTEGELLSFIKCFSAQLPAEAHIANGDFYFWGARITRIF